MQPLSTVHFVTNGSNGETLLRGTAVFILAIFLSPSASLSFLLPLPILPSINSPKERLIA